ncbi:hypothetical protein [Roseomonas sp. 18066]|uniref:hypothetical protein n=1 Tax=Roseomonas sp. 18066 TaxID=2681412 RepID=UPI00135CCC45|nr:hypothetical protein [Roseomonas sp. 18066]
MDLIDFVKAIRFEEGRPRFATAALDAWFAGHFPLEVLLDPRALTIAAVSQAALMTVCRELLTDGLALAVPGQDGAALRAAGAALDPGMAYAEWPAAALPPRKALRCLLLAAPPPFDLAAPPLPYAQDKEGCSLVAFAPAPLDLEGALHFDFPGLSLAVRP